MNTKRRFLLQAATAVPFMGWLKTMNAATDQPNQQQPSRLVLSDFTGEKPVVIDGSGWRGFSDQVMGGVSNASLDQSTVVGKNCARLTGTVTRESNGGFIQMAMYFGSQEAELDATGFSGLELQVYGNNEDYNVHIRTADCGWYDESYRATFFAKPEWQTVRLPWSGFEANSVRAALDPAHINRIAVLGWMREFEADIALAELALYS